VPAGWLSSAGLGARKSGNGDRAARVD